METVQMIKKIILIILIIPISILAQDEEVIKGKGVKTKIDSTKINPSKYNPNVATYNNVIVPINNKEYTLIAHKDVAKTLAMTIVHFRAHEIDLTNLIDFEAIIILGFYVEAQALNPIGKYIIIKESTNKERYKMLMVHELTHIILPNYDHCNEDDCPELIKPGYLTDEKYLLDNWDIEFMKLIKFIKEKQN